MQQYNTQYGTIFAVREYKGHPAIMLRAEHKPDDWSLSSMIEPFTPGAWTAEELQAQLDNWAAVKGWRAVEDPAGSETREIVDDEEEKIRATDSCKCRTCKCESCFAHGCAKECPANAEESCLTIGCPEYVGENEPCKTETPAPTGAAAATTDGRAVTPMAAETSTTSESGEGADRSMSLESGISGPSTSPARGCPAETGDAASVATPAASPVTTPSSLPAFDYTGLPAETAAHLQNLARRAMQAKQRYILDMMEIVAEAHRELVAQCDKHNNQYSESTFRAWCASIGVGKDTAYRLLQVQVLMDGSTPEEQEALAEAPASLLYAAAKPSAPAELVQAVKDGDITTHKQYQEALAEIRARDEKITELLEMSEAADRRADKAEQTAKDTARERDAALQRANAAENRAAGAQKLADQRGTENTDLRRKLKEAESRPIDIAVAEPSEADKERWRKEGEDRMAATLQDTVLKAHKAKITAENQVADLQEQLAAARPDADACQRTADTLYETTENLRLLLRTQLKLAQLPPDTYGKVVAHVLQTADALRDTVRSCAPADYTMDDEEEDFL